MADADGSAKAFAFVHQMAVSATTSGWFLFIYIVVAFISLNALCFYLGSFLPDIKLVHITRVAFAFGCCIIFPIEVLPPCWLGVILLVTVFILALFIPAKYIDPEPWILSAMQGKPSMLINPMAFMKNGERVAT